MRSRSHSYSILLTPSCVHSQVLSSCVPALDMSRLFQFVTVTGINGGMSQDLAMMEELEGRGGPLALTLPVTNSIPAFSCWAGSWEKGT